MSVFGGKGVDGAGRRFGGPNLPNREALISGSSQF